MLNFYGMAVILKHNLNPTSEQNYSLPPIEIVGDPLPEHIQIALISEFYTNVFGIEPHSITPVLNNTPRAKIGRNPRKRRDNNP